MLVPSADDAAITYCRERADIRANFAFAQEAGYAQESITSQLIVIARRRNLDDDDLNDITMSELKLVLSDLAWAYSHGLTPAATFDITYEACKRAARQLVEDEGGK